MKSRTTFYRAVPFLAFLLMGGAIAHTGQGGGYNVDDRTGGYGMGHGMMGRGTMGPGMMGMPMMSADNLSPEQLDRIGEHMQRMHEHMEAIANAKDPEARREAVKRHLQSMQAFMHERHDMMEHQSPRGQGRGDWQQNMEERMRQMERMMQNQ